MIEIAILFCVSAILLYLWTSKRPPNFPPGPTALPIIGNSHQMPKRAVYPKVEEWSKQFGPIIGLKAFGSLTVMITGTDNIIAALRKEEFQSRPDTFSIRARSFGKILGLFFGSGEQWSSTRKFVVKNMRVFGKKEKESIIADEVTRLMETFTDGTIKGNGLFGLSAVNVIWTTIASKRIDLNDKKSRQFLSNLSDSFRRGSPSGLSIVDWIPALRFINSDYKAVQKMFQETQNYIKEAIDEHREVLDPNNPMDLIDYYLLEMEQNKGNPASYFTVEDLIMVGLDLFAAGSESTSNSIEFILLYMTIYPEIQEKMQNDIDKVLGRSRKPTLEDKVNMHYTMAVINEVERMNSVVPTNVPHLCTKDTTFGGYFIPKDTVISMNLRSLGYDLKYWKNPEEFNPERFLNADGKYTKSSTLQTFGLGHRTCVGEVLSRNSIFLFTATFFEKFSVSVPDGEPQPSTEALPGFTSSPPPFKITIKSRY